MPSAVTHQSHIRSPDEVTASVRPLPTPLSWSPIDSIRNFGVKGNHRRDPPTAHDRPFMQPAGNVTLSNYRGRRNPFTVVGAGIGGIGASSIEANGEVYNLRDISQFASAYGGARYGFALG